MKVIWCSFLAAELSDGSLPMRDIGHALLTVQTVLWLSCRIIEIKPLTSDKRESSNHLHKLYTHLTPSAQFIMMLIAPVCLPLQSESREGLALTPTVTLLGFLNLDILTSWGEIHSSSILLKRWSEDDNHPVMNKNWPPFFSLLQTGKRNSDNFHIIICKYWYSWYNGFWLHANPEHMLACLPQGCWASTLGLEVWPWMNVTLSVCCGSLEVSTILAA